MTTLFSYATLLISVYSLLILSSSLAPPLSGSRFNLSLDLDLSLDPSRAQYLVISLALAPLSLYAYLYK